MEKAKFTDKELEKLERIKHLHNKLQHKNGGLSEDEYEEYEKLKEDCRRFLPIF